jgi:hypothetical protein
VSTWEVPTPRGPARLREVVPAVHPRLRLVLGHGAGGTVQTASPDLAELADGLPARGVAVLLVDQPWRVAGRRVAPAPAQLDEAWRAVVDALPRDLPLVVGGRSAGARVACRTATAVGAVAVVALAFPLHPPGRPERSRAAELLASGVPTLVVQGRTDPFGRPEQLPGASHLTVVGVDGNHTLSADPAAVVTATAEWLAGLPRPQ